MGHLRDAPYFGFEIPNAPGKYFYVWLDAPIGYMGSFKNLCDKRGDTTSFDEYWKKDSTAELYHFIGKDIVYFHSLFWPAMLEGSNFRKPTNLFVHGYVTVNGAKMSKSRGTFIKASTRLNHFDADSLRYYYTAKLSSRIDDIDLNTEDFVQRVNADIVNKVVNLASRNAGFISKRFDGVLAAGWPTRRCTKPSPTLRKASAKHGTAASSVRPSAKSWPSPTWLTATSTSRRRGWWRNRKAATPTCRPSAPWA